MLKSIKNDVKRIFYKLGLSKNFKPVAGSIYFGDLYRTKPLSTKFGFERGGAIDRYYIEKFLQKNKVYIKGRVLEVADNIYTKMFGGENIILSDVLHVVKNNPHATIVADLGKPINLGENLFDCIILTQTLQFIFDSKQAVENCYKLLKPGGVLLLTVPGISHIGKDPWNWYWSFTSFSVKELLLTQFNEKNIKIETYGNVLVASSFLYGIGQSEINVKELDSNDPSYQLIITAFARKAT